MADLKTNYKDDVLNTSKNTKRKYNTIQNSDGTISLEDVTEYMQNGDDFGAADINATNAKVNMVNSNLGGLSFAQDANGNWGYRKPGADSVLPFKLLTRLGTVSGFQTSKTFNITAISSSYKSLTASDFLIDASGMSNAGRGGSESAYRAAHFYAPTKSYNASTGILTVNSGGFFYDSSDSSYDYKTGVGTITVYLSN